MMSDREKWKKWSADQREAKFHRDVTVQVKSAVQVDGLKAGALSDPAKFAEWPLKLKVPPHHAEWYRLSQLYKTDPRYRKLLILAPTDWGKTTVFNLCVPLYEIVKDRSIRVGMIGNNLDNTKQKFSNIKSQLTDNKELIQAFGHTNPDEGAPRFKPKLRDETWTRTEIVVAGAREDADRKGKLFDQPTISAFGWESAMEGRHWDLALCDDVVDYIDAQSPLRREQYIDWYNNVFKKRMDPEGREIWIGTRAHAADLYQYLMESGEYTLINIPQALEMGPDGAEVSTWPERWTTEKLVKEREANPVSFNLKRMNIITGSGMTEFQKADIEACKDKALRYYGNIQNLPHHLKEKNLLIYAGVDLATGTSGEAKYFVIFIVGVDLKSGERYLLHLIRGQFGVADQRQKVRDVCAAWGPVKVLVENNSVQKYFFEDSFAGLPVEGVNTGTNKVDLNEGIPSLVSLVKAKKLHIPWEDANAQVISRPFIKEMEDYPRGDSSDIIMGWWFTEREVRLKFLAPPKINPTRNFFRRGGRVQIRRAGGFARAG